jgi:mannonate dehydratase
VADAGHTAQLHVDLASYSLGIQQGGRIRSVEAEIFRGWAAYKDGHLWASDSPGWGIQVNEELATKYPFRGGPDHLNGEWGAIRRDVGAVTKY